MIEHFHRPGTVREALRLARTLRGRAAFLAGGTWLNSNEATVRPEHAISLDGLGLDSIQRTPKAVVLGAGCTLQRLADDRRVPAPLQAAVCQVVSRHVRDAATLGGHLALGAPWSDVLPMLVALAAKVTVVTARGSRTLKVEDYLADPPAGLVTKVTLPRTRATRRAACRNTRASANARSTVSVAVSLTVDRKTIADPIVAVAGIARHVVRLTAVEEALDGRPLPALDEVQALVSRAVRPVASPVAGAALRRYEAGAVVALALAAARGAEGGRR